MQKKNNGIAPRRSFEKYNVLLRIIGRAPTSSKSRTWEEEIDLTPYSGANFLGVILTPKGS